MKKRTLFLVLGVLSLVVISFAVAWRPALGLPSENLVSKNSSAVDIKSDGTANNAPASITKASVNGITAEIIGNGISLYHGSPSITVCSDVPSVADWLPHMSAMYNDQPINITGWGLLDPDNASQSKHRCYVVVFEDGVIDSTHLSGKKLVFSLDYFEMSLPEKLPAEIIARAKGRLKDSGIDFEIQNVPHTLSVKITKKPDSITNDQALQAVEEAIESSTDKVYGPWVFVINN